MIKAALEYKKEATIRGKVRSIGLSLSSKNEILKAHWMYAQELGVEKGLEYIKNVRDLEELEKCVCQSIKNEFRVEIVFDSLDFYNSEKTKRNFGTFWSSTKGFHCHEYLAVPDFFNLKG